MKYLMLSLLIVSCSQADEGFIDGITAGIMVDPDIEKCINDSPKLKTCHENLIDTACILNEFIDIIVIECHREKERQNRLYDEGKTKLRYPHSLHNKTPSLAIDIATKPLDWNDREQFTYIAGLLKGVYYIRHKGHLRWGGDWNDNLLVKDNKFDDLVHFEMRESFKISTNVDR